MSQRGTLPIDIDWNTVVISGYYVAFGNNGPNHPDITYGLVSVEVAGAFVIQTMTEREMSRRRFSSNSGSTWTPWLHV